MGSKPQRGPRVRILHGVKDITFSVREGRVLSDGPNDMHIILLDKPALIYSAVSGSFCSIASVAVPGKSLEYLSG